MLKRLTILVLSAGLTMSLGGCTSKKAADESTADVAEVAGEGDAAAGTEELGQGDDVAAELGGDSLSADEQLPEEKPAGDQAAAEEAKPDEFATPAEELSDTPTSGSEEGDKAADSQAPDQLMADQAPAPTEPSATPEPSTEPPPPSVEEPMAAGTVGEPTATDEPKKVASLKKIADAPYTQGKILVNAVYLARKGDTVESIATKIYGSPDKAKELVKVNPILKGRGAKVGDKVYYNSPQRPTDETTMKTYYEDVGLSPEIYAVKAPENIRTVAKNLLGDTNSWKELWATNMDLESKGELAEGTQIRYWASAPAMEVGQGGMPPAEVPPAEAALNQPPPTEAPAPPPPVETAPPPPPAATEQALAPPPPPAATAPPPPPPGAAATAEPPPPPPPPGEAPAAESNSAEAGAMDMLNNPDQTMAMGAGAILLLGAVAIFIMIRKRKRRQLEFHTSTQTQIE